MLTDEQIEDIYRKYRKGEIDSTSLQGLLRDEVPIPPESLIATILNFFSARKGKRDNDPEWLAFLQASKKDYYFFIAILGNSPEDMTFKGFTQHAIKHGKECKEKFDAMSEEELERFWKAIEEVDFEIRVFGDEF